MTDREGASIQGEFRHPGEGGHRVRDLLEDQARLCLRPGGRRQGHGDGQAGVSVRGLGGRPGHSARAGEEADLAVVQEISPGPGRAHLQAYLDQEAGRILVCSQGGKQLASLKVGGPKSKPLSGLYLANLRGDLRLEWLQDRQMERRATARGQCQPVAHPSAPTVRSSTDRSIRFDASTREFVIKGDRAKVGSREDKISGVFLSLPGDDKPRAIRAVYQDGTRLSGELERVEKGSLVMKVPGIEEPPRLPIAGLRSLVVDEASGRRRRWPRATRPAGSSWTACACPAGWWTAARQPGRAAWSGSRWPATRPVPSSPASPGGSSTGSLLRQRRRACRAQSGHGCYRRPAAAAAGGSRRHGR